MAQRRMFTLKIVDTDAFLDMPTSTQNLYFHLGMRADDEGFIGNIKRIMKMVGSSDDDKRILIAKRFLIEFESGVVVIKHWKMNNYLQSDRVQETSYLKEKSMLYLKDNNSYTLDKSQGTPIMTQEEINRNGPQEIPMDNKCIHSIDLDLDIDIDKSNISLSENRPKEVEEKPKKEKVVEIDLSSGVGKSYEPPKEEIIFRHWNSKNIIKHNELTQTMIKIIKNALRQNTLEEIKTYIDRYATVIKDEKYSFSYKWKLDLFIKQKNAMLDFKDDGSKWINYTEWKNKTSLNKASEPYDKFANMKFTT